MPDLGTHQQKNIQGIGLAGFRKDYQHLLAVRFQSADAGRRLLTTLAPRVATTWEVRSFNEVFSEIRRRSGREHVVEAVWTGLVISAKGFATLGVSVGELPQSEGTAAFTAGMAARGSQIGDTRENDAATQWLEPFQPDAGVDALIVLAADAEADLDPAIDRAQERIERAGCEKVWDERGKTLPGALAGHEHFGFKDGVSQPSVDGFDRPPAAGEPPAVPLGEFVLGYPDAAGQTAAVGELWLDGSFVVFRRLHQDVAAFRALTQTQVPDANPALTPEQLGAKMVGRWPSGAPTELSPDADPGGHGATNAFGYGTDADGFNTPRFAHIRKVNPRDEERPDADTDPVNRHRMIRRGIPYGDPLRAAATEDDGAQRGLHFLSVVSDVDRQFEQVQRRWANDANFPNGGVPAEPGGPYTPPTTGVPADGPDPIVGEHDPGVPVALHQQGGVHQITLQSELVRVTAGEYFFAPSVDALNRLAEGATASSSSAPTAA